MGVNAKIRWLKPDEGGRAAPPAGRWYSAVAKFESQSDEQWRKEAWSLVLDLEDSPDETWTQTALVRFLAAAEAPADWLQPRKSFELFEGSKKVAEGRVLEIGD